VREQICSTPATSFDTLLWQLEAARDDFRDEELLDTIIAGLKGLARPACSLDLDQPLKAERGDNGEQWEAQQ